MLVKQSIVEKWYQRDSWVYKNFAYLFVNPLWSKRVPQGFSVCPYFWLNLFSLLLFRPFFVAPIQYVLKPLIKLGGRPVAWLDRAVYNLFDKCKLGHDEGYKTGFGFWFSLVTLFFLAVILFFFGFCGVMIYKCYLALSTTNLGLFTFWSGLSFGGLYCIIGLHRMFSKTECKTMYYLALWLIAFIPAAFIFVPTETCNIFGAVGVSIGQGVLHLLLACLAYLVIAACWVGHYLAIIFSWKPISAAGIPWWGFLLIITIVGWLSERITRHFDEKQRDAAYKANPEQVHAAYRDAWVSLFTRLLLKCPYWVKGNGVPSCCSNDYIRRAVSQYRYKLFSDTFEAMWANELDQLKLKFPHINGEYWDTIVNNNNLDSEGKFYRLQQLIATEHPSMPSWDDATFFKYLKKTIKNSVEVANLAKQYEAEDEAAAKRAEARKKSWSHVTCLKFTNGIANGFGKSWTGIRYIGVQIGTFFAYMWMLGKAKKQGACPYFRFTDTTK